MATLQEAADALRGWIEAQQKKNYERGLIGYIDAAGVQQLRVPNQPNRVYVRIVRNGTQSVITPLNYKAAFTFNLPVLIKKTSDNNGEVVDVDAKAAEAATGGAANPGYGVGPHSHRIGFGLEDLVEARRFEPGLVKRSAGNEVYVDGFFYRSNGVDRWFPGQSLSLTGYITGTASFWNWVKIGFNTSTGVLVAVAGTAQAQTTSLRNDQLATISLGADVFPLAGVKVKNAQVATPGEYAFVDLRLWVSGNANGETVFLRRDGTLAMAAALNMGEFAILANTFIEMLETDSPQPFLTAGRDGWYAGHDGLPHFVTSGGLDYALVSEQPDVYLNANADSDEFNGNSVAGAWAWENQASATATVSKGLIAFAVGSEAATDHLHLLVKTAPATPYTLTVKAHKNSLPANSGGPALILRDSTTDKLIAFETREAFKMNVVTWVDAETQNSIDYTTDLTDGTFYMRLVNDGTDLFFLYSQDGENFYEAYTTPVATWISAPDQIGLGIVTNGGLVNASFDYFRVT